MTALAYTLLVQADLSGTAFGGSPTWTDLTRFVRLVDGLSITNWRQDALSTIAPSTCGLTLDNDTVTGDATAPNAGRFTPGLSTSPWSGHILPGVRFRISVTISGTTFNLFDGYALDWEASYDDQGAFTTCQVNLTDVLGWMGYQKLRSLLQEELLRDVPKAYWPLQDDADTTSAQSLVNAVAGGSIVTSKYGAGTLAFGSTTTLADLSTGAAFTSPDAGTVNSRNGIAKATYLVMPGSPVPASGAHAVHLWFLAPTSPPATWLEMLVDIVAADGVTFESLYIQTDGKLNWQITRPTNQIIASPSSVCDGRWHHVVATVESDLKTTAIWLDGTLVVATTGGTAFTALNAAAINLGVLTGHTPAGVFYAYTGALAHVAVFSPVPSSARIGAYYAAGANAFSGENTGTHLTRLLGYRPNVGSVVPAGAGVMGRHVTAGSSLQQALLDTGKAEGGVVYADGQGRVTLVPRSVLRNPSTVLTLDAEGDITVDFHARIDVQQLYDDITISRPAGADQRAQDAASETAYGDRTFADTLILSSDIDGLNAANWLVANYKTPAVRSPNVVADLTAMSVAQAQAVLGVTPLQRLALSNLPTSAPPTSAIVQGRSIAIGVSEFSVGFFTSQLPRQTLRFDATADAFTKLDQGNVFAW